MSDSMAPGLCRLASRGTSLLDFAVEHSLRTAEAGTVEDRIRAVDAVLRILQKSAHPIEREERIRLVAERLGLSQQRLIDRYPPWRLRISGKSRTGSGRLLPRPDPRS